MEKQLIELANRIRAIAQNGLVYSLNEYDTERYEELLNLSSKITSLVSGHNLSEIKECFSIEKEYVTPKVDIRAVVFNANDEILMVKEKADGCWSLPGGWADVGFSPKEIAIKEVKEETGLDVVPIKLLAVLDQKSHNHPPALHYAYKIFILCEISGGELSTAFDILDCNFYPQDNLPPLSLNRVLKSQIDLMYQYKNDNGKEVILD